MTFSHLGKFLALSSILCFHEKQIECVKDLSSPSPNPHSPFHHFCLGPDDAENYAGDHLGESADDNGCSEIKVTNRHRNSVTGGRT